MDKKFVSEYPSISDAGRETGVNYKNISSVCNGKRNNAGGYIWEFAS